MRLHLNIKTKLLQYASQNSPLSFLGKEFKPIYVPSRENDLLVPLYPNVSRKLIALADLDLQIRRGWSSSP